MARAARPAAGRAARRAARVRDASGDCASVPDEEWQARTAWATFVAADGSLLVGMAAGMPKVTADAAVLLQMYVRPDARGPGVAERLVDAVVDWARSEGFQRIELGVNSGNERAERLYARCGFARTGERIHQDGYGEDIRMARML